MYTVIQTIQSPRAVVDGLYGAPVEVKWCETESLAEAIVALGQAAVGGNDPWFTLIGVRMEMGEVLTPHVMSGKVQA